MIKEPTNNIRYFCNFFSIFFLVYFYKKKNINTLYHSNCIFPSISWYTSLKHFYIGKWRVISTIDFFHWCLQYFFGYGTLINVSRRFYMDKIFLPSKLQHIRPAHAIFLKGVGCASPSRSIFPIFTPFDHHAPYPCINRVLYRNRTVEGTKN